MLIFLFEYDIIYSQCLKKGLKMIDLLIDVLLDCLKDMCFILPVLYLTYLLMETIEHFAGDKTLGLIKKSRKLGPFFGAVLGAIPECGIAGGIANLYVGGVITVGAFIAAILSTSDEMLAILLSSGKVLDLAKFLVYKLIFGCAVGFIVDVFNTFRKELRTEHGKKVEKDGTICELCEREHCLCGHHHHHDGEDDDDDDHEDEHGCGHKIWLAALMHTLKIGIIVFVVSFILCFFVEFLGEEKIATLPFNTPVVGQLIAALFGLVPNCSVSVIFSELYSDGILSAGPLMAGLLANGGVGILVLLRMNRGKGAWKKNLAVILTIYVFAVIGGLIASLIF